MSEKQTLATKGLYFSGPPAFCDDGEDAMYLTFPDGHTVKYVPERTCRDDGRGVFRCSECGAFAKRGAVMDLCREIPIRYCPNCGAKVVE